MGPYKATIQQLFFVAGAIQRDPGAAEEVILALCPGSYFYIKSKAVTATVQIYLSSFNHLNILLTAKWNVSIMVERQLWWNWMIASLSVCGHSLGVFSSPKGQSSSSQRHISHQGLKLRWAIPITVTFIEQSSRHSVATDRKHQQVTNLRLGLQKQRQRPLPPSHSLLLSFSVPVPLPPSPTEPVTQPAHLSAA